MAEPMTGTMLIVPGKVAEDERRRLGGALAVQLGQPAVLCLQEDSGEPVAGIRTLVASGVQRLAVIPVRPSPEQDRGVALRSMKTPRDR